MGIFASILGFVPNLINAGKSYVDKKQEIRKTKIDGEIKLTAAKVNAQIKRLETLDAQDNRLDEISLETRGYKDDYLLLLTTTPLVLLFVSPIFSISEVAELQAAVLNGFKALESTPEYYWWALAIIYIDTFGFRRIFRTVVEKKLGVK